MRCTGARVLASGRFGHAAAGCGSRAEAVSLLLVGSGLEAGAHATQGHTDQRHAVLQALAQPAPVLGRVAQRLQHRLQASAAAGPQFSGRSFTRRYSYTYTHTHTRD